MLAVVSLLVPLGLFALLTRGDGGEEARMTSESLSVLDGEADVGAAAPEFTLTSLDGEAVSLADYRGRVVVVNFWASWCAPCRKEFPLLQEVHDGHGGEAVVLAVIYNDLPGDARAFMDETGATFPALLDPEGDVARRYGIAGIPQTFLVDRQGVLRDHLFGIARRDDLEEPLSELLDDASDEGSDDASDDAYSGASG